MTGVKLPTLAATMKPRMLASRPTEDGPNKLLSWLRIHALLILFVGSVLGAVMAAAAWTFLPAKYESYALLQVASQQSTIANPMDGTKNRTDLSTYLKTTAQLIKSEFVLSAALRDSKLGISELATLKQETNPLKYLDDEVQVVWADGSEVVRIVMKGDNPDDVAKIVDAVQKAFMKEVVEKEILRKKDLLTKVRLAKTELADSVRRKGGIIGESQALVNGNVVPPAVIEAGGVPPAPLPGNIVQAGGPIAVAIPVLSESVRRAMGDLMVRRLSEYEEQLATYPTIIADRERRKTALAKKIETLKTAAPPADAELAADKDPEVMDLKARAKKERGYYQYVKDVATNPDTEAVEAFLKRAEALEKEAEALKKKKAEQLALTRKQAELTQYEQQFADQDREITSLKERYTAATTLKEQTKKALSELPPEPKKEDKFVEKKDEPKLPAVDADRTDLIAHGTQLDLITRQEIGLDLEVKSPPRVQLLQPASSPVQKDTKKQILATLVAFMMGFACVAFGAVCYEVRTKRVSSLAEVKTPSGLPVVGVIPWNPQEAVVTDVHRRALAGEALDRLRAYVAQAYLAKGANRITVTGTAGEEGQATTALGLATSLASAGVRTLLIDFDLRNPCLHTMAGVAATPGINEILRGETDPATAVIGLPGGLYLLPGGRPTLDARQAAVGPKFDTLLARLGEPFDCVVFLAHPLLAAAETVEVARRSSALLLCTLYRETRSPLFTAAVERIATLEIPHAGVVYLGATPREALC